MSALWKIVLLCLFSSILGVQAAKGGTRSGVRHYRKQSANVEQNKPPTTVTHDASFVPDAILRVTHENASISCYPEKKAFLVNGTAPGPELRIPAGKTVWIRVYNDMDDHNLTMHWHGLSMAMSPFADGTPAVSQHAIPHHHYFDYEMNVPLDMVGTYFYHSHVGFQAITAGGPLIVEDLGAPPYDYEDDKMIFIGDVFKKDDETIEKGLTSIPFVWSGETNMVLINGRGGGDDNGTFCNASLAVIDVKPDTTYRFRFVGATALTFAIFQIEGHEDMAVIEADGHYTKPLNTSFMQVGPGQRFSTLLKTLAKPEKSTYLIQVESRERPTVTRGFAILRYSDPDPAITTVGKYYPPEIQPWKLPNTSRSFLDYELRPLTQSGLGFPTASEVTRRVVITTHQYRATSNTSIEWRQNSLPWTEHYPKEPYLVSLYKSNDFEFPSMSRALENGGLDPVTRVFPAEMGEVLEIVIQNTGSDFNSTDIHPFHAHGKHYWDCGAGDGKYDPEANERRLAGTEPVQRDTTMLYRYDEKAKANTLAGWRVWRLRVEQPGAWMIHCHILQHMIMGMQTVWVFGNETDILSKVPLPQVEGYLTFGGSVYGNATNDPVMVAFQDANTWIDDQ